MKRKFGIALMVLSAIIAGGIAWGSIEGMVTIAGMIRIGIIAPIGFLWGLSLFRQGKEVKDDG